MRNNLKANIYQGGKQGDGQKQKISQELRARFSGRSITRNTTEDLARIRAGTRQLFQERSGQGMQERIPQKSYLGRVREGTCQKDPRKNSTIWVSGRGIAKNWAKNPARVSAYD